MLATEFDKLDGDNKRQKLRQIQRHVTAARHVCGNEVADKLREGISAITGPEYRWETDGAPSEGESV